MRNGFLESSFSDLGNCPPGRQVHPSSCAFLHIWTHKKVFPKPDPLQDRKQFQTYYLLSLCQGDDQPAQFSLEKSIYPWVKFYFYQTRGVSLGLAFIEPRLTPMAVLLWQSKKIDLVRYLSNLELVPSVLPPAGLCMFHTQGLLFTVGNSGDATLCHP